MKFKKILTVGIDQSKLDDEVWKKIDSLTNKRVSIVPDNLKVADELKDTECLLVQFNKVDKGMIHMAPTLKYIGALATGVGKIDTLYAVKKGIVITNIPGYSTESVAEFVIAVLLENIRDVSRAKKEAESGNYSESGFSATEIKGKKVGIIGLGRIGERTAQLIKAFGAEVFYWSKNRKKLASSI